MGMPTVYMKRPGTFHRTKDCVQLTKNPPRGGEHRELQEISLEEYTQYATPRPCRSCYPDAPRARSRRQACEVCNNKRVVACEHNGGVPVMQTCYYKVDRLLVSAGESFQRLRWVWPEDQWKYLSTD